MSRTLGTAGALASHVAQPFTTLARCLRLDLFDGTSIGITDHDRVLSIDLGDGAIDYLPDTGVLPSAVALTTGFEADSFEASGPLGDLIARTAILGGRFDMAGARLFDVNWATLASGPIALLAGHIAEARAESGRFVFEVRSVADRFNQVIGRVTSPYCDADYGDTRCGAVVASETVTVASVASDLQITVTFAGTVPADDYFNYGLATFTTGVLAGTRSVAIFDFINASETVEFDAPLAALPEIGDELTLKRGCGKTRAECLVRENVINFRGFPDMPGTDKALRYAVPGS